MFACLTTAQKQQAKEEEQQLRRPVQCARAHSIRNGVEEENNDRRGGWSGRNRKVQ